MVTHLLNGMLAAGALDDSVCTAGCDCEAYLYGVNATSAAHVVASKKVIGAPALTLSSSPSRADNWSSLIKCPARRTRSWKRTRCGEV